MNFDVATDKIKDRCISGIMPYNFINPNIINDIIFNSN